MNFKGNTTSQLASWLPLWFALPALLAPGMASPNQTTPDKLTNYPKVAAIPGQSQEFISSNNEHMYTDEDGQSQSQTAKISNPILSDTIESETLDSPMIVPCLHGLGAQSLQDQPNSPAANPCAQSAQPVPEKGLRFGHDMSTRTHMLGDVDGFMLNYGLGNLAFNAIAGFPSGSGANGIDPSKHLFGFSAGIRGLPRGWDIGGYMMEKRSADQNDSSTLGGAIRYSQYDRSLLISADYDLSRHSLSRFMVSSAWRLYPTSTLSTTLDIHQSNRTTPLNGYLQQSAALLDGWSWGLPFERINELSAAASTDVAACALSLSHLLSPNLRLNSDLAVVNVSTEEEATGSDAALSEFNEYHFNLTLSGKGLLLPGENNTLSFRSRVSDSLRLSSSLLDVSYALSHQWLLAPRLQIEYQDNLLEHTTQWVASPALKVEYRWRKQSMIHFTTSGEWRKHTHESEEGLEGSYVVSLGYQTQF